MLNENFGNLVIGQKFHKGISRHAGAQSDVEYYEVYEKISNSQAKCVKQVGYGNERHVGHLFKFSFNSQVFLNVPVEAEDK